MFSFCKNCNAESYMRYKPTRKEVISEDTFWKYFFFFSTQKSSNFNFLVGLKCHIGLSIAVLAKQNKKLKENIYILNRYYKWIVEAVKALAAKGQMNVPYILHKQRRMKMNWQVNPNTTMNTLLTEQILYSLRWLWTWTQLFSFTHTKMRSFLFLTNLTMKALCKRKELLH